MRGSTWGRSMARPGVPRLGGALLVVLCALAPAAHAQDVGFRVVVNEENTLVSLTPEDLGRIFLKRVTNWENGMRIAPVDQTNESRVRGVFSETVHGRSASAIVSHWQQQIFSGRDVPPVEKRTDAEVIEYVRTHPGAIGYVTPNASTAGVRVIEVVRVVQVR